MEVKRHYSFIATDWYNSFFTNAYDEDVCVPMVLSRLYFEQQEIAFEWRADFSTGRQTWKCVCGFVHYYLSVDIMELKFRES